jgi:hypothetical protein
MEPVVHDTFIDDLAPSAVRAAGGDRAPGRRDPRRDAHRARNAPRASRTAM